ncbi:hypothetical protein [Actinoplanes couchii]|uniref:Integral membrane protein n=1 Tax=Actinoplanes couchii TaxID=403638 RepID=A0ABQ3XFH0_9ACTN|nr:hypothetical protein [Actinoplanes couchii]MDR6321789.1 hypothetical protein [Actinoplanes couchii]GID57253.1 hypothetical protein Aco03nite_056570 [Actinoplanes couchii]
MINQGRVLEPGGTGNGSATGGRVRASRYGGSGRAVGVFAGLVLLAGFVIFDSSHLMSNNCFDDTGQIVCPISGPDWARPLPGVVTLVGLLVGLAGLAVGRPVRTGALIAAFVLVAGALIGARLIG